jgi:hypothetical protein
MVLHIPLALTFNILIDVSSSKVYGDIIASASTMAFDYIFSCPVWTSTFILSNGFGHLILVVSAMSQTLENKLKTVLPQKGL